MQRIEKTVFLSYRRTNVPWALAIFQYLTQHGYDVFFDFNGIASGDFERVILGNIAARAHFLVLLTPSALERCGDPEDWLRREIEEALARERNMVPLMLDGFDFASPAIASQLIGKLAALKQYNALSIPPEYFPEAMERLRNKFLSVPLDAVLHPASVTARRAATVQKAAAGTAPKVLRDELTAQQWYERGVDAADPDEKLRYYNEAIQLKPDYADAFNNRGAVLINRGDVGDAVNDFNEAIRLDPTDALPLYNRGIARYEQGDLDGAVKDYNKAIRLRPEYEGAIYNRGLALHDKGDLKGALRDYTEALRLKPDDPDPYIGRGRLRYSKGDLEGALQDYNEALRLKPDDAVTLTNRGLALHDQGELKGALQDFNKAIRIRPAYAYAFNGRGRLRYKKGDFKRAMEDYNEAIRLDPEDTDFYYNRALVFADLSDYKSAIADYKKYLDLGGGERDGDQAEVEESIRDLKKKLRTGK